MKETCNKSRLAAKPEENEVLLECRRRMAAIEEADESAIRTEEEIEDRLEELEFGPAFSTRTWFGVRRPHARMRYLRAILKLEAAGLLVRRLRWGRRLSAIRLTEAGVALADELVSTKKGA